MAETSFMWQPRRIPLAWRFVWLDRARFAITVVGIGFTTLLMLFLFSVWSGVRTEANGYVDSRPVDAWLALRNANSLIRGSSYMQMSALERTRARPEVAQAAPLLRVADLVTFRGKEESIFLLGIDPASPLTLPRMVEGSSGFECGEIVLDRSFARKHDLLVGDSIAVQDLDFRIAALSIGTNTVILQFGFVCLEDAQMLISFPSIISYVVATARPGISAEQLVDSLSAQHPAQHALSARAFSANNLRELQTGLLPVLWTVALFGLAVGLTVLTLLLYGSIIERRDLYALMQALGADRACLVGLVLRKSFLAVGFGLLFGIAAYFVVTPVVHRVVPELVSSMDGWILLLVAGAVTFMGTVATILPVVAVSRVYPAEVFRA